MRQALDFYDMKPPAMTAYLRNYGWHFSKKAYEFAASLMRKRNPSTGKTERVPAYTKEEVDKILQSAGVTLEKNVAWDYVFVAQMCRADYLNSSVPNEQHLALYVKDTIDDVDAADGVPMRRWYATMVADGYPIEWEEML